MKAQIELTCGNMCGGGVRRVDSGRVHKVKNNTRGIGNTKRSEKSEEDTPEVTEYLKKLQELVPFMPKHKKLTNLEVISNVIDYIHDLRETLGFPPCDGDDLDCLPVTLQNDDNGETRDAAQVLFQTTGFSAIPTFEVGQEDVRGGFHEDGDLESPQSQPPPPLPSKMYFHHQSYQRQPLSAIPSPNGNVTEPCAKFLEGYVQKSSLTE